MRLVCSLFHVPGHQLHQLFEASFYTLPCLVASSCSTSHLFFRCLYLVPFLHPLMTERHWRRDLNFHKAPSYLEWPPGLVVHRNVISI